MIDFVTVIHGHFCVACSTVHRVIALFRFGTLKSRRVLAGARHRNLFLVVSSLPFAFLPLRRSRWPHLVVKDLVSIDCAVHDEHRSELGFVEVMSVKGKQLTGT